MAIKSSIRNSKRETVVVTPRGKIVSNHADSKAYIEWKAGFPQKWNKQYRKAQIYHDKAILDACEPYIPKRRGALILSGYLGTILGSGTIQWVAPYAVWQYYKPNKIGSATGPLRGPHWFERMKAAKGGLIVSQSIVVFKGTTGFIGDLAG